MSVLDVYIGDLNDPNFKLDGGDWNKNIPKMLSPYFPHTPPFLEVIKKIDNGEWKGKQTDYGAFVAILTKQQIEGFVLDFYKNYEEYWENYPHLTDKLKNLKEAINKLEDNQKYALVACEI